MNPVDQQDFRFTRQFLCGRGKCGIGHDDGLVAIVVGHTGVDFLNRLVANLVRIVFALDRIFVPIFVCDDIDTLIAASFGHQTASVTVLFQPVCAVFLEFIPGDLGLVKQTMIRKRKQKIQQSKRQTINPPNDLK